MNHNSKDEHEDADNIYTRSLNNKIINEEYRLNQQNFQNRNNLENQQPTLSFTNINLHSFLSKKVHSIDIFSDRQIIEVHFLKHKLKRNLPQERSIINDICYGIISSHLRFYEEEKIRQLLLKDKYNLFLNQITSKEIFSLSNNYISNSGLMITYLEYLYEKYSFLNNINFFHICAVSQKIEPTLSSKDLVPNSLFLFIFDKIKNSSEKKMCFIGESGMGKTNAFYLLTYVLRLNPYNIIIPLFNDELLIKRPIFYLTMEVIYSLSYLYNNNIDLDIKELEELYLETKKYNVTFEIIVNKIVIILRKVFEYYNNELMIYIFVDSYEKIDKYKSVKRNLQLLYNKIEDINSNSFGFVNTKYNFNIKIVEIGSNDDINSDKMIKEKILYVKEYFSTSNRINDLIFGDKIIFLSSQEIFHENEFIRYIKNKLLENNLNIDNESITNILKLSNSNYSVINCIFQNEKTNFTYNNLSTLIKNKCTLLYTTIYYNQNNREEEKDKLKFIYDIFSYMKINDIKEKMLYSYYNNNYNNYNYNLVIPYLQKDINNKEPNSICFKAKNNFALRYINEFKYDEYYKSIDLNKIPYDFLITTYNETRSSVLKGILLEEILYYLYNTNFKEGQSITVPFTVYGRQKNFEIKDNMLIFDKIKKIVKSQCKENDFFEKSNYRNIENGIYFLSHKFPCVDTVIFHEKMLVLVQIKKTLTFKHLYTIQKDIHYLNLMLENESFYKEMWKQNESYYNQRSNNEQFNTKLNFWLKLTKFIKQNPDVKLYYMFAYKSKSYGLDLDVQYDDIRPKFLKEFKEKNESIKQKLYCKWEINDKDDHYYVNKSNMCLFIKCSKVIGNIMTCSLQDLINDVKGNLSNETFNDLNDDM